MDPKQFFIYQQIEGDPHGFQTESMLDFRTSPNYFSKSVIYAAIQEAIENPEINLCRGDIKREYIEYAFHANTHRFLIMKNTVEPKVYGILFAKKMGKGIYLDVICSAASFGSIFLNYFFEFCQKSDFEFIKLSSLATVLSYYPRLGFKHRKSCKEPVDLSFPPALLHDIKTRRQRIRGKLLDSKQQLHPTTDCNKNPAECASLLEDVFELLKYPPFRDFLNDLRQHGYTAKGAEYLGNPEKYASDYSAAEKVIRDAASQLKRDREAAYEYKEREYRAAFLKSAEERYQTVIAPAKYKLTRLACSNPATSIEDFVNKFDCYEDGFTMIKCLGNLSPESAPVSAPAPIEPISFTKAKKTKKAKRSPARLPTKVKKSIHRSAARSARLVGTKRKRSPTSPRKGSPSTKRTKRG